MVTLLLFHTQVQRRCSELSWQVELQYPVLQPQVPTQHLYSKEAAAKVCDESLQCSELHMSQRDSAAVAHEAGP